MKTITLKRFINNREKICEFSASSDDFVSVTKKSLELLANKQFVTYSFSEHPNISRIGWSAPNKDSDFEICVLELHDEIE